MYVLLSLSTCLTPKEPGYSTHLLFGVRFKTALRLLQYPMGWVKTEIPLSLPNVTIPLNVAAIVLYYGKGWKLTLFTFTLLFTVKM